MQWLCVFMGARFSSSWTDITQVLPPSTPPVGHCVYVICLNQHTPPHCVFTCHKAPFLRLCLQGPLFLIYKFTSVLILTLNGKVLMHILAASAGIICLRQFRQSVAKYKTEQSFHVDRRWWKCFLCIPTLTPDNLLWHLSPRWIRFMMHACQAELRDKNNQYLSSRQGVEIYCATVRRGHQGMLIKLACSSSCPVPQRLFTLLW